MSKRLFSPSLVTLLAALAAPLPLGGCSASGDPPELAEDLDDRSEGVTGDLPVGMELQTTGNLNLRSGPSTSHAVLRVLAAGSRVTLLTSSPSAGFYEIEHEGTAGWSSGKYLEPAAGSSGSTGTPFAGGEVWTFHPETLGIDVAVFVPEAASHAEEVDVLVYAHGLNVCSPVAKKPPRSFVTDAPFALGEIVAASQRPVVLVVPWLDWEHLGANGMAFGGKKHRLAIPKNLNGVVAEVLGEIGDHRGATPPALSRLILAGHSRAYDFLNPLAAANADPEMSTGALARLSHVWAFDTTYACSSIGTWPAWLASKPSLEIDFFYRDVGGTSSCGHQMDALVPASEGRLSVTVATESHCAVPGKRLPSLLAALP